MIFLSIPSAYAIERYGTKIWVVFAIITSIIGIWVQEYANGVAGEIISNIGLPFYLNGVTRMTSNWFYTNEKLFATTAVLFMI